MKSTYHTLFECICANAQYSINRTSLQQKKETYDRYGETFNKKYWAFFDSLVPPLLCNITVIEDFMEEPYDYYQHIEPLVHLKFIWVSDYIICAPHMETKLIGPKNKKGIIKDYYTNTEYLQFFLGHSDPNKPYKELWL